MNDIAAAILKFNNYCTLATVSADGTPWGTPVHFAYDENKIYWVSNKNAVHSVNLEHNPKVSITIFDSHQAAETLGDRGAVYIASRATKLSDDAAMAARDVYSGRWPDDNSRKMAEWEIYSAPIGVLNETKSKGQLLYFSSEEAV